MAKFNTIMGQRTEKPYQKKAVANCGPNHIESRLLRLIASKQLT